MQSFTHLLEQTILQICCRFAIRNTINVPMNKISMTQNIDHPIFKVVGSVADENNVNVYVIGGYVRDLYLHRPSKDIDMVVIGDGITLAEKVAEKLKSKKLAVFKTYGTAMIKYRDLEVEFVGARKESYNEDSRNPTVESGTLEDDQNRRDFTINALAISLNKNTWGDVLDPFGGLQHIEEQIIKTPLNPDITFSDDPLRMMRAIRFASQLNFIIEEETFKGIERNHERIKIITKERIAEEINKIILSPKPSVGFKLLEKSGLLSIIFPEMQALKGVDMVNGIRHKDNFYHTLTVLDNICQNTNDLWVRWSAILHDIGKPRTKRYDSKLGWTFHGHNHLGERMVSDIFKRMKLPLNEKMKFVQNLVSLHMRPIVLSEDEVSDAAVRRLLFDAGDNIDDLMTLCEADITSKDEDKVKRYLRNFKVVRRKLKEIEEKDKVRNFQPPISGELIMKCFGLTPCRQIGDIKEIIKDAILDGKIQNDFEEAYNLMLETGISLGLTQVSTEKC